MPVFPKEWEDVPSCSDFRNEKMRHVCQMLKNWIPDYDSRGDFVRVLLGLLGAVSSDEMTEEVEALGYRPLEEGIGWHELDMLGQTIDAIRDRTDVNQLLKTLIPTVIELQDRERRR